MDEGASVKLSFLVVILVSFTSFLSPLIAEARQKHEHHNNKGHHRVKYSPLPSPPCPLAPNPTPTPTPAPSPNGGTPPSSYTPAQSTTNPDNPLSDAPSPPPLPEEEEIITPPPPYDPYNVGTPSVFPPPGYGPPYEPHGCHYPCADSNDCDWPCTVCCWNNTCCYDWPELPYE